MRIGKKVPVRWYSNPNTINEVIASFQSLGSVVSHRFGTGQIAESLMKVVGSNLKKSKGRKKTG